MDIVVEISPASKMKTSAREQVQPQAPLTMGPLTQGHVNGMQDGFSQKDGGPRPVRQNMFRTAVSS